MSIPLPRASLLLDGDGAAARVGGPLDTAQAAVRRLVVDLSVDEAHDRVEVDLWGGSVLAAAQPGAVLAVALGDEDGLDDVCTAEVAGVDEVPWGSVLTAYAPSRRLSSVHVGRAYRDRTVREVVLDLLGEGEVEAGEVEAPLAMPVLQVDPRRAVWGHLHALARRTGHQVVATAAGAVSFVPAPGSGAGGGLAGAAGAVGGAASLAAAGLAGGADLRKGAELLDYRLGPRRAVATPAVRTPWSGTGTLLAAEPDAGEDGPVRVDPALRTREAADAAAAALAARARRAGRAGWLRVPGRASLRAGGTVPVAGEAHRVLRVRHRLDAGGWTSELLVEGAS